MTTHKPNIYKIYPTIRQQFTPVNYDQDIYEFINEHSFLSNFWECPFWFGNIEYLTVEHFFQACKATTKEDHIQIAATSTPSEAKKLGRKIKMRDDWDEVKICIMAMGLIGKFSNAWLWELLTRTGDRILHEGNNWNDAFWGIDLLKNGEGLNILGHLLMELRDTKKIHTYCFGVLTHCTNERFKRIFGHIDPLYWVGKNRDNLCIFNP
jgi:ribA/ribD-fused uncharacterized protein